jgi:hypothetical protein
MQFITDQMLHLGCGLFIAIAANNAYFLGPLPDDLCATVPIALQDKCRVPQADSLRQIGQFVCWGIGFAGIAVGSGTFGNEKVVYWRERQAGIPALPYFFAKILADVPRIALAAACFMLAFILGYNNNQSIGSLYIILFLLYLWGFSCGYFISAISPRSAAPLVGVVFALVWAIALSGVSPSIKSIRDERSYLIWLYNISAPRWAISAFYLQEIESKSFQNIEVGLELYGYENDSVSLSLVYVLCIALGWQLLAMLSFKLLNRDKQK